MLQPHVPVLPLDVHDVPEISGRTPLITATRANGASFLVPRIQVCWRATAQLPQLVNGQHQDRQLASLIARLAALVAELATMLQVEGQGGAQPGWKPYSAGFHLEVPEHGTLHA